MTRAAALLVAFLLGAFVWLTIVYNRVLPEHLVLRPRRSPATRRCRRPRRNWWLVLELTRDATLDDVETAFKRLAGLRHPDVGGTHEAMARLAAARDVARRVVAGTR